MSLIDRQMLESNLAIPARPSAGTQGKGIRLSSNLVDIKSLPLREIFQYNIKIQPQVSRHANRAVFNQAEKGYGDSKLGGFIFAYDGQNIMYSLGKLKEYKTVLEVELPPSSLGSADRKFQMIITWVSSVSIKTVNKFLDGKLSYTPYDAITALEVILRHPLVQTNIVVGRSLYNNDNAQRISGGLEVWKGYFMSIRPGAGRLLLNVDTTATTFFAPGKCIDLVSQFLHVRPGEPIKTIDDQKALQLEQLLRNLKVLPIHRPACIRPYRVLGLTSKSARERKFTFGDEVISVFVYFQRKYNLTLKEPDLPCLVVGSRERPFFLPIECCDIPPRQRFPYKLGEEQTSDLIKIASQHPDQRFDAIVRSSKLIDTYKEYFDKFQIQFGSQLVQVNARVLKTPTVFYHRDSQEPACIPAFGAWNLKGKRVETGVTIESWAVVNFAKVRDDELDAFVRELAITCTDTGVPFKAQRPPYIHAQSDIAESVKQAFEAAKKQFGRLAQFVLVVLPSTDSYLYGEVKRCSDTVIGLPTQCMQVKHLRHPDKQYCANLALKINVKCGGVNSNLDKQMPFINEKPTMVLGAHINHQCSDDGDKPSIAAVVASMDVKMVRHVAVVRVQVPRRTHC